MPKFLVKLAPDKFVEWSTICDAPRSYVMNKEELKRYLLEEYGKSEYENSLQRIERCDLTGTSALDGSSAEDIISGNRAGPKETELSIEEIIQKYSKT